MFEERSRSYEAITIDKYKQIMITVEHIRGWEKRNERWGIQF